MNRQTARYKAPLSRFPFNACMPFSMQKKSVNHSTPLLKTQCLEDWLENLGQVQSALGDIRDKSGNLLTEPAKSLLEAEDGLESALEDGSDNESEERADGLELREDELEDFYSQKKVSDQWSWRGREGETYPA